MVSEAPNKLEVRDPARVEKVLALSAAGATLARIKEETGCAVETIQRIRQEHPQELAQWRKVSAAKTQAALDSLMDKILLRMVDDEAMDKERLKDLALSYGILTDKTLTLHGEASSIVEHKSGLDVNEARKALEMAQKRIQGEAIDV